MVQEYVRTGYVWEQYDALSGEGKRRYVPCSLLDDVHTRTLADDVGVCYSHPFTGWTSLVALGEPIFNFHSTSFRLTCGVYSHLGEVLSVAVVVFWRGMYPMGQKTSVLLSASCC